MASTQKAKIPVGFVIASKYRVTGELGRGGMAAVYEAENVDIGKRVAIKVLAQELISSTIVVERFLREARAVAAIRSPYICDVYDSGRLEDGRPFLVLELLEGESLYERMVRLGQIDVETTVAVMAQTCRGLTRAHAAGIVHRDLKPENIFVTRDEEGQLRAKILDFGLAKFYQPVDDGAQQARLTRDGAVFGTPAYMSPEQVRGQGAVDARADLWALGCITYECVTGRTVWSTDQGVAMTFAQIAQCNLPDPLLHRPDLPDSFRLWFQKGLHKDIAERFQTPKEFAEQLVFAANLGGQIGRASEASDLLPMSKLIPESSLHSPGERLSGHRDRTATSPSGDPLSQPIAPTPLAHETSPSGGASPGLEPARSGSGGRALLALGVLATLGGAAYFAYRTLVPPSNATGTTASADAGTIASPSASTSVNGAASSEPLAHDVGLPFRPLLAQAQGMIAAGDIDGARLKIKEAVDAGGHHVPQTFLQHLDAIERGNKLPPACKVTGLARPRSYDLMEERAKRVAATRPAIAVGPHGAVLVWTETTDGQEQAHAVGLDEALRAKTKPFNVSPEGLAVQRPEIMAIGEQFLITYWDTRGPEMGVYARYLDANGRIASAATAIAKAPGGASSATVSVLADKTLLFTWLEPTDKNTEDVYARKYTADLQPSGDKVRLSAFTPKPIGRTKPRAMSGAIDGDSLRLTFRLERDPERVTFHMRTPLDAIVGKGVTSDGMTSKMPDRFLGEGTLVSPLRQRADYPSMSCTPEGCFIVWNEELRDGIFAAPVLKGAGTPLYKKKVVQGAGRNPGVGAAAQGDQQLFWYERGKLMTSRVDRDGIRDTSVVARMTSVDRPAPSVAAGPEKNQWFAAWNDFEGGTAEVFAVRVVCK